MKKEKKQFNIENLEKKSEFQLQQQINNSNDRLLIKYKKQLRDFDQQSQIMIILQFLSSLIQSILQKLLRKLTLRLTQSKKLQEISSLLKLTPNQVWIRIMWEKSIRDTKSLCANKISVQNQKRLLKIILLIPEARHFVIAQIHPAFDTEAIQIIYSFVSY
ncbi:unnamed protein product [Paramecium pentaurelia]|uniref:Uncharacterized protein n=1 Tax=Paramecium pentaurelia TaxID=43138 RepID=A0A8S1WD83_9CILI|nr:unnamed protein product [Paramecium pentaurelia]